MPTAHYRDQLDAFRSADEARWTEEASQLERQTRVLREHQPTEEAMREALRESGLDVGVLERASMAAAARTKEAHDAIREVNAPLIRKSAKESIVLDELAARAAAPVWIYPPAYEGWGKAEDCGFNLALGEINTERHLTGDGWGLQAKAYATQYCILWFYYYPPTSGELLVEPHVDFQGSIALSAHDHWYTSTHAEIQLKLHFDLFQHYWDGETVASIVDEHRHNSSAAYWLDKHQIMSKTMSVSARDIVWIRIMTSLRVVAHSSHAHVDCDFRTGSDRRIRVEHIRTRLQ